MDDSDLATCHEEMRRNIALHERRPTGPAPTGLCLACDEPVPEGRRWCNAECREDWERRARAERMKPCCRE